MKVEHRGSVAEALRCARCWCHLALLLVCCANGLEGQAAIGDIGSIAFVGSTGCGRTTTHNSQAGIWIRKNAPGRDAFVAVGDSAAVRLGDRFLVPRVLNANVSLDSIGAGGALVLAPQLLCPGQRVFQAKINTFVQTDTASYRLTRNGLGQLQLSVRSGGVYIEWNKGNPPLFVLAGGDQIEVPGTHLVVIADSSGDHALLYVRDGVVRFPAGGSQIPSGQLFELGGAAPGARPIDPGQSQFLQTAMTEIDEYREGKIPLTTGGTSNGTSIWRTPWPYLGLGAAAGVVTCVATTCWDHSARHGTVLVQLPF